MTDQIPADKVRAILDEWERIKEHADWDDIDNLVQDVRALLPTPPRPTLADMTADERAACRWMQADTKPWGRVVIATPFDDESETGLISADGGIAWAPSDRVTPRPDLPRMTWPGDTPTAPDHLAVGTVIESADDPRIAALPVGSILLDCDGETAINRGEVWMGDGYTPIPSEGGTFGPWTVLHIPKEADQ